MVKKKAVKKSVKKSVKKLTPKQNAAAIRKALKALGTTKAAVAGKLKRLGFKGHRCYADECPIANYLKSKGLNIGSGVVPDAIDEYGERVKTTKAVEEFICAFDNGDYPQLVT